MALRFLRLTSLTCLLLISIGCAGNYPANRRSAASQRTQPKKWDVELVTIEDQAIQDVEGAVTKFELDFSDNTPARERLAIFYDFYLKEQAGTEKDLIDLRDTQVVYYRTENYLYRVKIRDHGGSFTYDVACQGNRGTKRVRDYLAAQRNAKNLARFIKDGSLEVSLLEF